MDGSEVRTANPVCVRRDPAVQLEIEGSGSSRTMEQQTKAWVEALEATGATFPSSAVHPSPSITGGKVETRELRGRSRTGHWLDIRAGELDLTLES